MVGLLLWTLALGDTPPRPADGVLQKYAITYRIEPVRGDGSDLDQRFTSQQLALLEKLNRADVDHLRRLPALVVPDTWLDDDLAYSPLPRAYPAGNRLRRLIVVHQPGQVFGAYAYGALTRWGPVSTGRKTHLTPAGIFHLKWRARRHISTFNPEWVMDWTFNFDSQLGLAFHRHDLPGQPASHACVRLLERDAQWLFNWGDAWTLDEGGTRVLKAGTPVFIIGEYRFDDDPPWQSLEWLARSVVLPPM